MKKTKTDLLISIWVDLGIAIIILYFVFCFCIGGSALNGYIEAGKYFVASHEELHEVSKTIWIVNKFSGILFYVFIPLTPIGGFVISDIGDRIEHRKKRLE